MPISADVMRLLLLFCLAGMALIAGVSLWRRSLSWQDYLVWGAVILLIPVLGPVLVITARPGPRRAGAVGTRVSLTFPTKSQLLQFMQDILSGQWQEQNLLPRLTILKTALKEWTSQMPVWLNSAHPGRSASPWREQGWRRPESSLPVLRGKARARRARRAKRAWQSRDVDS